MQTALRLKQVLKPYLLRQLGALADWGLPVMRPLWFDFAEDGRLRRQWRLIEHCYWQNAINKGKLLEL